MVSRSTILILNGFQKKPSCSVGRNVNGITGEQSKDNPRKVTTGDDLVENPPVLV